MRLFDLAEEQQIIVEYQLGMTQQEIARKHYCSHPTIRTALIRNGITPRGRTYRNHYCRNTAMVEHDWNAGVPVEQIARTYGFNCYKSVWSWVIRHRARGNKMKYRNKGELA